MNTPDFEVREVGRDFRRELAHFVERLLVLAGDEDISTEAGAIDKVEHRRDETRRYLLYFDYHAELRKRREHVAQAGYADSLVAEGKGRAVEGEHPARVGGRELGVGHLADDAGASAVALEMYRRG